LSYQKNVQYAGLIFETVWGLITRQTSPKQLMDRSQSRSCPVNRRSLAGSRCSA